MSETFLNRPVERSEPSCFSLNGCTLMLLDKQLICLAEGVGVEPTKEVLPPSTVLKTAQHTGTDNLPRPL